MDSGVTQQQMDRLLRLEVGDDVWQVGEVRLEDWLELRPQDRGALLYMAASTESGRVGMNSARESAGGTAVAAAFDALLSLAGQLQRARRPVCVELADAELQAALEPVLADCGIACRLVEHASALDEPLDSLREELTGEAVAPSAYAGLTSEGLRSFASAVALMYAERPWRRLSSLDIVQVESPVTKDCPAWFTLNGMAGDHAGLTMMFNRTSLERILETDGEDEALLDRAHFWSVGSMELDALSVADRRRFEAEGLPRVEDEAPFAYEQRPRGEFRALTPEQLSYAEAVVRAVTLSTDEQLDGGRWECRVPTAHGEVAVRLSLPAILELDARPAVAHEPSPGSPLRGEAMMRDLAALMAEQAFETPEQAREFLARQVGKRIEHRAPETPEQKAQELVYAAHEYDDRRRLTLARRAIATWPDCADAYLVLAEEEPGCEEALALHEQAVAAGERAIGKTRFRKLQGHFWGFLETRPYMRARFALAGFLAGEDRAAEAIGHYWALLELCPDDNMGVRSELAPLLLEQRQYSEARRLFAMFDGDGGTTLDWAIALLNFAEFGDAPEARASLEAAQKANRHVLKFLVGSAKLGGELAESYTVGGEDEAEIVADRLLDAFEATPGAVDWLKSQRKAAKREGKARRRKR